MINTSIKLFFLTAILIVGITAANAQIDPQSRLKTNVPFSFVVDGKTYPAGLYTFTRLDNTSADSSEVVMRTTGGESVILNTLPTVSQDPAKDTQLVFKKVAGQNVLSQIWVKGDTEGIQLLTAKAEVKAIAAAAAGTASGSTSSVNGN